MITVSYLTNRIEPKFEWFFSSLSNQAGCETPITIVDFYSESYGRRDCVRRLASQYGFNRVTHISPKPTVWSGAHRLTKADYFAASNARNTAIAVCRTDWVVFVDDLSVLMPGWFGRVVAATARDGITLGTYRKVKNIQVEAGVVSGMEDDPNGHDNRIASIGRARLVRCPAQAFYGCSFVAPIKTLLQINGFDEDCDGMGYEDSVAGLMLAAHGVLCWFDSEMVTYEDGPLHHQPGNHFLREDPGVSPNDKSHKILELVRNGRTKSPNYFGPEGLCGLRGRILSGQTFPVVSTPDREWFTGEPLTSLPH